MEDVVIIGFGGHAKSVADCIVRTGEFNIVGYTDVCDRNAEYKYLGTDEILKKLFNDGIRYAVLGIGYMGDSYVRDDLVLFAKRIGYSFPVIIDPSAVVSISAVIGEGTFVGKNAVVNAEARVGAYSIINTGAIVEHESEVGEFSHIAVGAILCGNTSVGERSFIGAGSTIIQGVSIGEDCIVGAGSIVLGDVDDGLKVYGIVS